MSLHGHRRQSIPPAVDSRRGERGSGSNPGDSPSGSTSGGGGRTGADLLLQKHDDWQDFAACAGSDSNLFFPKRGDYLSDRARQLCAQCPVWRQCIRYCWKNLNSRYWGYWGGLTETDRRDKTLDQAIALAESRRVEKAS